MPPLANSPDAAQIVATALFALAILHTFAAGAFRRRARALPGESTRAGALRLLGEVEISFGLWAAILVAALALLWGSAGAVGYVDGLGFSEPLFVFAVMTVAATRPLLELARWLIRLPVALLPPRAREIGAYVSALTVGPLLGSLITEPAAMTVTALLLRDRYFSAESSPRLRYLTLATLLVNVSVGGTLTHFAAPPVVMAADAWNWGTSEMLARFGLKAALGVLVNAALAAFVSRRELAHLAARFGEPRPRLAPAAPAALIALHLAILGGVVASAHHPALAVGLLLLLLGVHQATPRFQDPLRIDDALRVAVFLAALVVLGGLQQWWIAPALEGARPGPLFLGVTALTSFTDNAAIAYLGAQIRGTSDAFRYALLAGAVAGGGLTVIANAPNPAGFAILESRFEGGTIGAGRLFLHALAPTAVVMACFWFLPS